MQQHGSLNQQQHFKTTITLLGNNLEEEDDTEVTLERDPKTDGL